MKINDKYEEYFERYKNANPNWLKYLSNSTYYELKGFYADETNQPFDEDNGYPDDVNDFSFYIWNMYIDPTAMIIEDVEKRTFSDGIIELVINTNYESCIYHLDKQDNERCITIVLENNDWMQTTFVIPMGEGFNFFNYDHATRSEGNKIVIILIPRKSLIGVKNEKITPKEIGEPKNKYL